MKSGEDWRITQDPVFRQAVPTCPEAETRGRFNLSVAPRRASISEGPWRYSRHASHARKLARDRTLVAPSSGRARGCEGRRKRGRGRREGGKGAREVGQGGAGGNREAQGRGGRKRGVLKRD